MDTFTIGGDLEVHRLGFGAMRITGKGIWGPPADREEAMASSAGRVELGVNLIDTADSYGPEVSENLIAEALHPYPDGPRDRDQGRPAADRARPAGRATRARSSSASAARAACGGCRLDRIDLYQLHAPDPKVPYEDSVGALQELQDEGKISHVGLSNVSVDELRQAQEIVAVVTVQNRYNLERPRFRGRARGLRAAGIGFIPWFPLATGRLAEPGGPLDRIAREHDATPAQIALAWLLARSRVMLPIPGTSSVQHLEENLAATRIQLSEDEVVEIGRAAEG